MEKNFSDKLFNLQRLSVCGVLFSLVFSLLGRPAEARELPLTIPIFSKKALGIVVKDFAPFIRRDDIFFVVTGNGDNPYDGTQALSWAKELKKKWPDKAVYLGTAGLKNLKRAAVDAHAARGVINGLTYIYEPSDNFYQAVPEFWRVGHLTPQRDTLDWTQENVLRQLRKAVRIARTHHLPIAFKPTGRPLYQSYLWVKPFNGEWNYGVIAGESADLWIQTQTYIAKGTFNAAFSRLIGQLKPLKRSARIQVSIGANDRNSSTVQEALRALRLASSYPEITGAMMWWGTNSPEKAMTFLSTLRPLN